MLVTGPNGNTMFLPAAGYRYDVSLYDVGSGGIYWSRECYGEPCSYVFAFENGGAAWRVIGFTVRAVRASQN